MPIKIYSCQADRQLIVRATRLTGHISISSFCLRASIKAAREAIDHVQRIEEEYQRAIVRRAMRDGCCSIEDLTRQTGLDSLALNSSLGELGALGEIEMVKGPRRKEWIYILNQHLNGKNR